MYWYNGAAELVGTDKPCLGQLEAQALRGSPGLILPGQSGTHDNPETQDKTNTAEKEVNETIPNDILLHSRTAQLTSAGQHPATDERGREVGEGLGGMGEGKLLWGCTESEKNNS